MTPMIYVRESQWNVCSFITKPGRAILVTILVVSGACHLNLSIFLGRDFSQVKDYSEETARRIDKEILKIVHDSYKRAKSVIQEDIDCLHNIANALLEKESLDAASIEQIMGNCRKDTQVQMAGA